MNIVEKGFNQHKFDAVMHFCALKAPGESMLHPTLFSEIRLPYACKLLIQELISMSIVPRLITT